jgi:lipopolysaccharide transport system permease protein
MPTTIIDANKKRLVPDLKELFRYKDLFVTLAWRDFKVRYAQTTIGFLWAFVQPIITLFILNVVFGKFAHVNTNGTPHLLFTITGLSVWTYFSFVMTNSGNSIISAQGMVQKIYFPRLIIPLSKAVVGLIDLSITLLILIALLVYYQFPLSANAIYAPLFIIIGMLSALAVGIWLSALTVRYRDFQHIVPFLVQIGLYATPVAYPISTASDQFPKWVMTLYYLNPMAGVEQGFRWSVLGGESPGYLMYISFAMVFLILISGILYFRGIEDEMADFV